METPPKFTPAERIEAIRRRPGMYVGGIDGGGLRHMLWEVVANAIDEHIAGRCSRIVIEIAPDGSISVEDNGRGMPLKEIDGIPFAQMALTTFHQTPTLDGHAPHEHIDGFGIGLFPVCALSAWLEYRVSHEGRFISQRFERGVAVSGLRDEGPSDATGTRIVFAPDPTIFPPMADSGPILARLREMSYFLPKLTFHFTDRREHILHEPRGIVAHVDAAASRRAGSANQPTFAAAGTIGQIIVEAAARWFPAGVPDIESYANIHRTTAGGTHAHGLLLGLIAGLKQAAPKACTHHSPKRLERAISRGLVAIVCVRLNDPHYESPTKNRLITPAAKAAVRKCIAPAFRDFLKTERPLLDHLLSTLNSKTI